MTSSAWEFPGFDPQRPNEARMLDYLVGGKDNFAVDREAMSKAVELAPELPMMAQEGRKFLSRVVRFLVAAGIRQFVDIGCGLPTQGYVHEIAEAAAPDARVAYVDNDPVVVAHARALLGGSTQTTVIQADLRDPDRIITHPRLTRLIDLERPVAVLLVSVLAVITNDELARETVRRLRDAVVPGSYLAISHAISDLRPEVTERLSAFYQDERIVQGPRRRNLRARADVEPLFAGLELVEPGIVHVPAWRPDPGEPGVDPASVWTLGGVGRKN